MNAPLPTGLQASLFGARQRLHIQHGPTDLVIDADGPDRLILFEAALDAMRDVLSWLEEVGYAIVGIGLVATAGVDPHADRHRENLP